MYSYVSAIALPSKPNPQWEAVNVSAMIVSTIFTKYRDVILTLQPPGTTEAEERVYVSMNSLRPAYRLYSNTLSILLQVLGDTTLETVDSLPTDKIAYVSHGDVVQFGYKLSSASAGIIYPENYPVQDLPDIRMERDGTDVSLIHTHGLVSVNGFVHQTDTDGERSWILQGNKTASRSKQTHVSLTSFLSIGKLSKIPITPEMIQVAEGQSSLHQLAKIAIPETMEGKSYFMVIGGYLVFPREFSLWSNGDKDIYLSMKSLPYFARFMESRDILDLSSLGISENVVSDYLTGVEELWSDEVITKYLTLSQSFVVVVDSPSLFVNNIVVRRFNTPGVFTSVPEPTLPLLMGHGRIAEYWKTLEDGVWAITVADSFLRNYYFNSRDISQMAVVDEALDFRKPFFYSEGRMLEIGSYRE